MPPRFAKNLLAICLAIAIPTVKTCAPKPTSNSTLFSPRDPGILPAVTIGSSVGAQIPNAAPTPNPTNNPIAAAESAAQSAATPTEISATTTFPPPPTFRDICQNVGGVVDGGRCFFLGTNSSWPDSWAGCRRVGGTLAQILTSSELNTVSQYLTRRLGNFGDSPQGYIRVALRRDPNTTATEGFMPLGKTFWYNAADQPDPQLSANDTWIRARVDDDLYSANNDCIHLYSNYTLFGDYLCASEIMSLCELSDSTGTERFTSPARSFCLSEQSLKQYTANFTACADNCRFDAPCRSIVIEGNTCKLYPWILADQPATVSNAACQYYQYAF